MRMDELQRGFWGYKKDSVYRYIVSMEEKASKQLAEKEEKLRQLEAEMKQKIAELEGEGKKREAELEVTLAALREENAVLRENQAVVFHTMMEAQKYADQLRADSAIQSQEAQKRLADAVTQQTQQLEEYLAQVQQIRAIIQERLKDFDGDLKGVEHILTSLIGQAPAPKLEIEEPLTVPAGKMVNIPRSGSSAPDRGNNEGSKWNNISFT